MTRGFRAAGVALGALAAAIAWNPALAADGPGGEADDTIIVTGRAITATKTETPIVETPQAISVITDALFEDRGARNVQETLRYTAGVTAESFGLDTRGEVIAVRGLNPIEYQDGMRRIYNFSPIPRVDVYTLSRVEVLRGPASVLYGQGANGGIVNLVSKVPEFTFGGEAAVQYGTYDRKQLQADITGPLGGDFAARLVGLVRDADTQTDHVRDDRILVSPSFSWKPSDRTSLTLIGLYQRDRTASTQQFLPVVATLFGSGDRRLDTSTFLGDPGADKLNTRQFSLTLLGEHRFSDAVVLRANARYLDAKTTFQEIFPDVYSNPEDPFIDVDDRVVNRSAYVIRPRVKIFTSDVHLQFDFTTGPLTHKLLAGVDLTDFRQRSRSGFDAVTPIDIYDPVSTGVALPPLFADPRQRNSQVGVYVQDQIRYADRVTLVIGARRDRARSKTEGLPEQVDKATTFRAGLIADIGAGISPYISYSEAFLPVAGLDFNNVAFIPQRGRQYEAGVKWQPVPGALVTVAAYDIEETNRPINDPDNVLNTIQTGRIRSKGVEFEAAYVKPRDFAVTAAYSYNKIEVRESSFAAEVGVQLNDTPKHLASLWGTKTFVLGNETDLRVGGGVRHVGSTISTGFAFGGTLRTPSYTLADALLALDWKQWSLSVNATNLFDKDYFAPCRAFGDCFTGTGRSVIGTLAYRF